MHESLYHLLKEPQNYFKGVGNQNLSFPKDILIFPRTSKEKLQLEAQLTRSHHRFVLIFNLETSGHVHINNLELSFHPNHALLVHPYQFHHYSHLASSQLKWIFCTFELQDSNLLEPLRNRTFSISSTTQSAGNTLLKEWISSTKPNQLPDLQHQLLQLSLLRLLIHLIHDRKTRTSDLPLEPNKEGLIQTVNRLLSEWRGPPIHVSDLANSMGISVSLLRIRFKEVAGVPIGNYIQHYRINRAMALLRTTNLTIADVAAEAGFGSPQSFSRVFSKELGCTPRSYRPQR
ncbi:MAG: helix-turn-helix transcriptional regulator [Pontiella sp.]